MQQRKAALTLVIKDRPFQGWNIAKALTFKESYCLAYECRSEDFAHRVLEASLYPSARRWLKVLEFIDVATIREAKRLIAEVGECKAADEVNDALIEYHRRLMTEADYFTMAAKLRLSCGKLVAIYESVCGSTISHSRDTTQLQLSLPSIPKVNRTVRV